MASSHRGTNHPTNPAPHELSRPRIENIVRCHSALLRYCELETLPMAMILKDWTSWA